MNAIDTNIFVYLVDEAAGEKQIRANQLVDELLRSTAETVLLWQVAAEFLNCMRRWEFSGRINRAKTIEYFEKLESLYDLILPARTVLHTALDLNSRYSLSHWDPPRRVGRGLHRSRCDHALQRRHAGWCEL